MNKLLAILRQKPDLKKIAANTIAIALVILTLSIIILFISMVWQAITTILK